MVKRMYIFLIVSLCLINLTLVSPLGVSPAYKVEHFEPYLEREYEFRIHSSKNLIPYIELSLEGDLTKYASLESDRIRTGEKALVTLKLPYELDRPGKHRLYLVARELGEESSGEGAMIGTLTAMRIPIEILVPYPGKYVESSLRVWDINEKEKADFEITIDNLGTENVTVKPMIKVYEKDNLEVAVITKELSHFDIETKRRLTIRETLETQDLTPGDYHAKLEVHYEDKISESESDFRVGKFFVEIIDYDYMFETGGIRPFNIEIENKWNEKISEIYAQVIITNEVNEVVNFRTISTELNPWQKKNITGHFDTTDFEAKRHIAKINLYYGGSLNAKLVAIYLVHPEKETDYKIYFILGGIILALIIILTFVYLFIKIRKLSSALKKNEKKK